MTVLNGSAQSARLRGLVTLAAIGLFLKVLLGILVEYRWYFPPDFDQSAFLSGRRYSFSAPYATAFYAHILSGPPALLLGFFLMLTGGRPKLRLWHRLAGKLLALIVLAFLVPSGLVMARQAYAGPIAAAGFAGLSIATGLCTIAAAYFAIAGNIRVHQRFAVRCFILLTSPLLLRLASGLVIVLDCESETYYQLTAWLSWLVPLAVYEVWCLRAAIMNRHSEQPIAISAPGTLP
jgi:uncharacterized membrane protein